MGPAVAGWTDGKGQTLIDNTFNSALKQKGAIALWMNGQSHRNHGSRALIKDGAAVSVSKRSTWTPSSVGKRQGDNVAGSERPLLALELETRRRYSLGGRATEAMEGWRQEKNAGTVERERQGFGESENVEMGKQRKSLEDSTQLRDVLHTVCKDRRVLGWLCCLK
ncbi:hypothetical protein BDZ89DRAFT_1230325 [Hymenopellis radicata]|nr:hypothetical protein BDZ89DRAFT_1230325 [Hymenopellis radicata]